MLSVCNGLSAMNFLLGCEALKSPKSGDPIRPNHSVRPSQGWTGEDMKALIEYGLNLGKAHAARPPLHTWLFQKTMTAPGYQVDTLDIANSMLPVRCELTGCTIHYLLSASALRND